MGLISKKMSITYNSYETYDSYGAELRNLKKGNWNGTQWIHTSTKAQQYP